MEPKENFNIPKERTNEVVTLELESDDNINATISSLSLVGKVISERTTKFSTLCAVLNRAWPIKGNFESHDLGKNFILFVFNSEKEKHNVLIHGPWSLQDKHIVLRDWPKEATLEEIDFSLSEFWVHIYNLPMALINEKNAQKIGSIFSKYLESNINDEERVKWDGFLKIKVAMRVDDPLKTGFKLKRGENDHIMVSFKYERMPEFCYSCGRMGHPAKECGYKDLNQKKGNLYGPWLRAPYSKKFMASPTTQHRLQNSDATMENAKAPRRRVENLAIEECKIMVPTTSNYEVEHKMSEQMKNKVETSLASGELYNSRQNQTILDASLNGFCPTLINSGNENIEALFKPKATLSISISQEAYQEIQNIHSLSSEETRATDGPSKIISKIEKKFKGKANGSRRLSAIKQAARENVSSTRQFASPHPHIEEIQCDEDAKFFLFANDTFECHSQEK
ncbi:hypothetical protein GQ457_09G012790 [Hibiscus cannabinus]